MKANNAAIVQKSIKSMPGAFYSLFSIVTSILYC